MATDITGKKIAILATDGFEESELNVPMDALKKAGAIPIVVSPKTGSIRAWAHTDWGGSVKVDMSLAQAKPEEFEGLVLPGGVMNPDKLRIDDKAITFIRHFVDEGKPIAAICHGTWPLIDAGAVEGRRMTSYASVRTDLLNAGAEWVDAEVVVDNGLVTSRTPDDLPAFCRKLIEEVGEGRHTPYSRRTQASRGAESRLR